MCELLIFAALFAAGERCAIAQSGVWETRAPFPIFATEVSAAAINDKVYVVGGYLANGSSNRLFIYDAFTDTWTEGAPLPIPGGVDHANVAAVNGKLYFLGAIRINDGFTTGRTFSYDPAVNAWTELAPMPIAVGASGVAAIGSRIYVAGGLAAGVSVDNFEAFDTDSNSWSVLTRMPSMRDHLTAQALNGKFYAISGRRDGILTSAVEEYDPATNSWRVRAPIPTPRGGLGSGVINGKIQVFGGEGSSTPAGTFEANEEYDPVANTWRPLAPMPTPRHGIYGATVEGKRIFVPAGGPRAGAFESNVHEAFYLPAAAPPSITLGGVVNAASYSQALAPGSIATIFGSLLSPGAQTASHLPLPDQMNATAVLVNGTRAQLLYVSEEQINFIVPPGVHPPASVLVEQAGVAGAERAVPLQEAAPGLFSLAQDGRGQGAVLHANTSQLADSSSPAVAGEALEIYCTGLGANLTGPPPIVIVGGVEATVLFFGNAPGFAGLNQVNIRVPSGIPPGPAVPVRISHLGAMSNEVTIALRADSLGD